MQASIQRTPSTSLVQQFDRTSLIESSETYVVSRAVVETTLVVTIHPQVLTWLIPRYVYVRRNEVVDV